MIQTQSQPYPHSVCLKTAAILRRSAPTPGGSGAGKRLMNTDGPVSDDAAGYSTTIAVGAGCDEGLTVSSPYNSTIRSAKAMALRMLSAKSASAAMKSAQFLAVGPRRMSCKIRSRFSIDSTASARWRRTIGISSRRVGMGRGTSVSGIDGFSFGRRANARGTA